MSLSYEFEHAIALHYVSQKKDSARVTICVPRVATCFAKQPLTPRLRDAQLLTFCCRFQPGKSFFKSVRLCAVCSVQRAAGGSEDTRQRALACTQAYRSTRGSHRSFFSARGRTDAPALVHAPGLTAARVRFSGLTSTSTLRIRRPKRSPWRRTSLLYGRVTFLDWDTRCV
jgi:hypothetical protein